MSKDELHARFNKFGDGQWVELMDEAHRSTTVFVTKSPSVDSAERRAEAAEQKVMLGEVSRVHQCLTGAALALGTEKRFQTMQNRRLQVATRYISQEAREFHPEVPVSIDRKVFLQCLKSAFRGSSPGPGGRIHEDVAGRNGHSGTPCSKHSSVLRKPKFLLTSPQPSWERDSQLWPNQTAGSGAFPS